MIVADKTLTDSVLSVTPFFISNTIAPKVYEKTATIIDDRDGNLTNCKRVTASLRRPAKVKQKSLITPFLNYETN